MPLTVPPAVNYPSPLVAVPSRVLSEPREGRKQIPGEIAWGSMGGASKCVSINIQNNTTLEISQIVALKVDNSQCGASVRFVFPDTGETVTIPAYTPDAIVEVFSNGLQMFVVGTGSINGDVTRFQILNFLPPPVVVPVATEQQVTAVGGISSGAAASTAIIGAGQNGTIEALQISFGVASPAADSNAVITLNDGTGKLIAQGAAYVKTGVPGNLVLTSLQDIAVRYENGVNATVSGLLIASGGFLVSLYHRQP